VVADPGRRGFNVVVEMGEDIAEGQGGSGTSNGGDGANGIVIVWEYLK
jgi:hypothetical protein